MPGLHFQPHSPGANPGLPSDLLEQAAKSSHGPASPWVGALPWWSFEGFFTQNQGFVYTAQQQSLVVKWCNICNPFVTFAIPYNGEVTTIFCWESPAQQHLVCCADRRPTNKVTPKLGRNHVWSRWINGTTKNALFLFVSSSAFQKFLQFECDAGFPVVIVLLQKKGFSFYFPKRHLHKFTGRRRWQNSGLINTPCQGNQLRPLQKIVGFKTSSAQNGCCIMAVIATRLYFCYLNFLQHDTFGTAKMMNDLNSACSLWYFTASLHLHEHRKHHVATSLLGQEVLETAKRTVWLYLGCDVVWHVT